MCNKKILLADDNENILDVCKKILTPHDFDMKTFTDGTYLLKYFKSEYKKGKKIPLCILDIKMPLLDGLSTAQELRKIDPDVIIIITGQSHISLKTIRENLEREIYYIKKPFNREEFFCLTDSLLKGWNKNIELKKYRMHLEEQVKEKTSKIIKVNRELEKSEEKFRLTFEYAMDAIFWGDTKTGIILNCNKAAERLLERKKDEIMGKHHTFLHPPDKKEYYIELLKNHLSREYFPGEDAEVITSSGKIRYVSITGSIIEIEGEAIIQGIFHDITERKEAEQELKKYREHLEELVEERTVELRVTNEKLEKEVIERKQAEESLNYKLMAEELLTGISNDFINLHSGEIDGEIEATLKTTGKFTGDDRCYIYLFSNNDFIINTVYEWNEEDLEEQVKKLTGQSVKSFAWALEKIRLSEPLLVSSMKDLPAKASAEKELWMGLGIKSILAIPIIVDDFTSGFLGFHSEKKEKNWKKEDIKLLRLVGEIFVNALKRKRGEEALRESERNFRNLYREYNSLIETIPDRVLLISSHMKILWANSVVKSERGDENLFDKICYKTICKSPGPCSMCPVVKCFSTGVQEREHILTPDNKYFDIIATPIKDEEGKIIKVLQVARDITEKMFLQKDAVRTSHLASIGELAAGVAHEINNPVTGIINYAQILANKNTEGTREYDICKRIIKEGERIALITRSLLSFARPGREKKRTVPLKEIIADTITLSGTQMAKEDIKTIIKLPEDLPDTIVNPAQIQQVFLNILSNARHALNKKYPERHENKIIEISAEKIINNPSYIKIIFLDYGCGISENIIDKVMNPFFSTEPLGEASGLGLSISYGIIKEHNGKIEIESKEGEFTGVIITLPIAPAISSEKIDKNHFF